jgi:hypothetical protein
MGSMAVCCLSNLSRNTDLDAVNDYAQGEPGAFGQNIYDSSMVSRKQQGFPPPGFTCGPWTKRSGCSS